MGLLLLTVKVKGRLSLFFILNSLSEKKMAPKRICLIGAGPSGMSVLYQLERLRKEGVEVPEVVCYEKQSNWGGLWNYTWRTGNDENGEPIHGSMYRYLWSNGPKTITERPILTHVDGKVVHFKDGTTAEVDVIMFCTGYLHYYPFIEDKLRLRSPNLLFPPNLYKGMIFTPEGHNGGSNKMLYLGSQDQYYTYTMFDVEALWALKYVLGEIAIPVKDAMIADWQKWSERLRNLKDCHEAILFQTDFVQELAKQCGYGHDLDVSEIFFTWHHHKEIDILSYRDQSFSSKFTGTKSPIHHSTFMSALDDSKECFMASK